jgi:hypothetical protein
MSISLYPEASTGNGIIQNGGVNAIVIDSNQIVTMNGGVQRPLLSGTVQTTTTGTAISFTGIPSWAKRITVMFSGVSTNGTANLQIQGYFGSYETSGYSSSSVYSNTSSTPTSIYTTGFVINYSSFANANTAVSGNYVLNNITGFTWVGSHVLTGSTNGAALFGGGTKTFGGAITQLRIIASNTANPSDTFDLGSMNILYE